MSDAIFSALNEINEAYEKLKKIVIEIVKEYNLTNSKIVNDHKEFLEEIGVLDN